MNGKFRAWRRLWSAIYLWLHFYWPTPLIHDSYRRICNFFDQHRPSSTDFGHDRHKDVRGDAQFQTPENDESLRFQPNKRAPCNPRCPNWLWCDLYRNDSITRARHGLEKSKMAEAKTLWYWMKIQHKLTGWRPMFLIWGLLRNSIFLLLKPHNSVFCAQAPIDNKTT